MTEQPDRLYDLVRRAVDQEDESASVVIDVSPDHPVTTRVYVEGDTWSVSIDVSDELVADTDEDAFIEWFRDRLKLAAAGHDEGADT